MHVAICGYPGSGKSTVFAALAAETWSERGVTYGRTAVPDARVERLTELFEPKKKILALATFMDVSGGGRADTGAFPPEVVQTMRNADVLVHVVRGFDSPMLGLPEDMDGDERRFGDELVLLDLTVLERRLERMRREGRKDAAVAVAARCAAHLEEGEPLRTLELTDDELTTLRDVQLLSLTPLLTLYNLGEAEWEEPANATRREIRERSRNGLSMALCGSIEAEIAALDAADQAEFLEGLGLGEPARDEFIRAAYGLLDLISFLTAGRDECRAWPIRRGTIARKAAGKVHSDIERGFIRAEVYRLDELEKYGSEAALKSAGRLRVEGKEYVVVDGDIVNFRFNV